MEQSGLSAEEMLDYLDRMAAIWRDLVESHPEILNLPCDVMDTGTVGKLLQHIVAVQLRYAERLAGLPATDYSAVPYDSAAALWSTHERSVELTRQELARPVDWSERIEFATRRGPARSSRKMVLYHMVLHSIRHYAQLATLVRQHGFAPGPQDYLFMDFERIEA